MTMQQTDETAAQTVQPFVQGIGRIGRSMGEFSVDIGVAAPGRRDYRPVRALVDTGSTYSVIPARLLYAWGITPIETLPFELADGSEVGFPVGEARIRVNGRERTSLVIFGADDAEALLGATTLQEASMAVDPANERLIPLRPRI